MAHRATVVLEPYSPDWPEVFEGERERLLAVLGDPAFRIEHVGSTAVPGLGAKPILDLLLGGPSLQAVEARIPDLCACGYDYLPEHEAVLPQRRFLACPRSRPRRFHLHGVALGSDFWVDHLLFRDALRASPELASIYFALKQGLADRFQDNRAAYTEGKSAFITGVVRKARAERALPSHT